MTCKSCSGSLNLTSTILASIPALRLPRQLEIFDCPELHENAMFLLIKCFSDQLLDALLEPTENRRAVDETT